MDLFNKEYEEYIEVQGIKLHTMIFGSGDPIFLLHGFPDFWYGWKNIILGLKDQYKLIVPDLRGYNLSDKPDGEQNYKLDILLKDIKQLAKKLNISKFSLVGHDWGGAISWAFAEKFPELLNKLIIINAPHPKIFRKKIESSKKQKRSSGYIFQMLKPGGEEAFYRNDFQLLKFAIFQNTRNKEAFSEFDKQKYIEAWSQPGSILGGVNYYRANTKMEGLTGIIKVPTLVIFGMKDNYVRPGVLEGLDEYVENLTIIRVENASHWVMHDDPEIAISAIKDFIK
ncbi:MAG: alpha/beta fold hydrolase [Candidatus Lokiarchaeota archaeon]|nr:alpha/beta fold hydrolase [Candidatus Lokiarchaeota archaeon]